MTKEKTLNIYQRINKVMADVEYIQKGERRVNNQYRFVSHDQVTGTLHGPMTKNGIVMVPSVVSHKIDGNRTEIMVNVRFVNMDDPQDFVSVDYLGFGIDPSDKGPGKAISYACKYALLKMFCLETGDDPDQDQDTVHKPESEFPLISLKQAVELSDLCERCDPELRKKIYAHLQIKDFRQLELRRYDGVKARIMEEINQEDSRMENAS